VNNQFEAVDQFHSTLRTMIQNEDSSVSSNEVEQEQTPKIKGKKVHGKFMTYQELDEQRHQASLEAMKLVSECRVCDVEGKKSFKHHGNFGGVFRSSTEKELNMKLNGDEMGASFIKLIAQENVKMNFPMATEAELKSFSKTGNFGGFSILQ
jgi:hypothetical protein